MLSIIVAKAKNNVIGKENKLIWHLPEDLKRFKNLTTGHDIIMGRKTFESLGRVLPNRHHIVLSNDSKFNVQDENVDIISDISLLDKYINDEEEHFVIGGASIYKLLMPHCKKMYITEIHKDFDGDTFFPNVDLESWKETSREKMNADDFDYDFAVYERK